MALRQEASASPTDPSAHPGHPEGLAVSLQNVTRVFGPAPAIVRVDLSVARGVTSESPDWQWGVGLSFRF